MTTPSEEYCRFRREMRDDAENVSASSTNCDHLFDDEFIKFAYDEAERQAAKIGKLLFDRTSYVCNIPLLAGVNSYRLDESVFEVARVTVFDGTARWTAKARDLYEYDMLQPDWRSMNLSVTKSVFVYDSTIEIAGNCDFNGTLNIECYRLPLQKASDADQFEISAQHHPHLIDYAKYLAYQTRDADTEQVEYARIHEERFRAYFSGVAAAAEAAKGKQRKPDVAARSGRGATLAQLADAFLAECGDLNYKNTDGRQLDAGWSRNLIANYIDEAEYEACERSNIIFDKDTTSVCQIPVVAGQSVYPLHSSIVGISYIKFIPAIGSQFDVLVREKVEFSQISPIWRTVGFSVNKCVFVHDSEIENAGIADTAGTLHLEVYRSPLANASVSGQFEIPEKYHAKLIDWVKYKAFSNPDVDIYDVKKSYVFYGQFQRSFGKRRDRKYIADEIKTALPVSVNTSGTLTPLDLCNLFRFDAREKAFKNVDGTLYDAGWRTDLLLSYADEAEREAAARASLIFDSETESVCKIAVTAGQSKYQLSELVVRVCKCSFVKPDGSACDLEVRYSESEDVVNNGNRTKDFLENRVVYIREGELSCQGNVSVAGDILLEVYRYPKVPASSIGIFEVTSRHHINLLHYIKYKAYSSVDNDVFHESAAYHERKFIDIYGSKKTESLVNRESIRYLRTNKRWY